ncbi:hypothetical protein D2A34_21925 [Clostridium chromiireducens]|uniref:Phage tail protein n=1 Tax=Clostridium chromiireducens TaxID=225345 RepID=A0A399IPH0_9CLOT|nr:phage tail protein [Clostridium chromiireducens]RII32856.1 hypothetical protein D2A34_21925 [Clostridium chromiireducens]
MSMASFATKVFEVSGDNKIYTFQDFQYSSSLQTDKQDSDGNKPSTYNKGPDLDSFGFKVKLDASYGVNPRSDWEEWKSLMESGVAYPFILGGKPLGSYNYILVGVKPSNFNIDNEGNILSLELDLNFDEYVRAGSADSNKKSSNKKLGKKSSEVQGLSGTEFASLIDD